MNAQELAEKIFQDIQKRSVSTTTILRDVKTLGKLLKNQDFDWVTNELSGYQPTTSSLPPYRFVSAQEMKGWTGTMPAMLSSGISDWLYKNEWISWMVYSPVTELEDLLSTGTTIETGKILKTLSSGYLTKSVYQRIYIQPREIKKILDQIQERVHGQIIDYLSQPSLSVPSLAILSIFQQKFPELQTDIGTVSNFLSTGEDFLSAARATRSVLQKLIKGLVAIKKPNAYMFSDGKKLEEFGEKSKMKFYLEFKGKELHHNVDRLLFLDPAFRAVYDTGSKALKEGVNVHEANLCADEFINFLENLYKFTDLNSIR